MESGHDAARQDPAQSPRFTAGAERDARARDSRGPLLCAHRPIWLCCAGRRARPNLEREAPPAAGTAPPAASVATQARDELVIIHPIGEGADQSQSLTKANLIGHPERRRRRFAPTVIHFLRISDAFGSEDAPAVLMERRVGDATCPR